MNLDPQENGTRRAAWRLRALSGAFALALAMFAVPAAADEFGVSEPVESNTGPGASVRPGAFFPSRGDTGLALDAIATYGLPAAPFVVAPGARFATYLGDEGAITGMPVLEALLPIGDFVPYVKGGVGVGRATGPRDTGVAALAGGGVDVHVTRNVLLGVDATWETVSGTGFNAIAVGPRAGLRY